MKKICIIADTLEHHRHLSPLIHHLENDNDLSVFLVMVDPGQPQGLGMDSFFKQPDWPGIFNQIAPEIVVVYGSRPAAFFAAKAAAEHHIAVAHIGGGESDDGTWNDALGPAITRMASLHFPSSRTYCRRVTSSGTDPGTVINAGSLAAFHVLNADLPDRDEGCTKIGLDPAKEFIFVAMTPDRDIGSQNRQLMHAVSRALSKKCFDAFSLVISPLGPHGFEQIMAHELDPLISRFQTRVRMISSREQTLWAMAHCRAMVGNIDQCVDEAAALRTPVVTVGHRLKDCDNPGHMIQAKAHCNDIVTALMNAMCLEFKIALLTLSSPFEQKDTPQRIKAGLKGCRLDVRPPLQH